MEEITKTYTNGEITIVWKPKLCTHSTRCWKGHDGLIDVFNPRERPWIQPENASTERIIEQVNKCPSGALSFYFNDGSEIA
ncbi:MAG: (4Fe-4S)-binding protein [Flavobacteriales bacterium]